MQFVCSYRGELMKQYLCSQEIEIIHFCKTNVYMRAVWKVSSHFEYLKNRSRGLGSQSEETLLCIREQPLCRGASQSAERRR